MTRWREARGAQLKRQFENASLYVRDLGDEQAERFGRGLNYLSAGLGRALWTGQGLCGLHQEAQYRGNEKRCMASLRA